jgi:hypothetical protein
MHRVMTVLNNVGAMTVQILLARNHKVEIYDR